MGPQWSSRTRVNPGPRESGIAAHIALPGETGTFREMSVSRHPIALRLEQQVGEGTRLLATVMGLPLLDGIFPALLLAGALDGPLGVLEVGLLVFGGSATVAVILADMDGTWSEQVRAAVGVGLVVVAVALVEAALAPTIRGLVDTAILERFAALVILAVAAKTASARVGEYLPRPAVIIGLGLVASFDPTNAQLQFVADPTLVLHGGAAAAVGATFAVSVAAFAPWLRGNVDLDRFRFGSAVALGTLPLALLGLLPTSAPIPLAVLGVAALLAFDPGSVTASDNAADAHATDGGGGPEEEEESGLGDLPDNSGGSESAADRAPWL